MTRGGGCANILQYKMCARTERGKDMGLTEYEKERYSRHIILPEIGEEGQQKLLRGKVLIIGAGGLASPAALYLAAAGVGVIGIADADKVDLSNLQRQIIHTVKDIGADKVTSAEESIKAINPQTEVKTYNCFVNTKNIADIIKEYDFVLDCCDNFETKFLINDACTAAKKPFSHAGILEFRGQLMTYVPDKGPCYRCIFKSPPPESSESRTDKKTGIIGAVAGVIGSMQAAEAIKYLTGAGELLTGCLMTYDALKNEFRKIAFPNRDNSCTACGRET